MDDNNLITSYEEKPQEPKGNLAVPPFYCYRSEDVKRIQEALDNGCGYDAPGSFAAWLSKRPRCTLIGCRVSVMTLAILTAMSM